MEYADGKGMMSFDDFAEELKSDSGCQRKVEQMMRFRNLHRTGSFSTTISPFAK